MGRVFGILFVVLALWTGVEVYSEGMSGAFGGIFVRLGWAEPESSPPVTERAARAFEGAYRESEERVRRQLE